MLTRREALIGVATASAAALFRNETTTFAVAPQPSTPVKFSVPAGACDCHVHVQDPTRFPYLASRPYTPDSATVDELRKLHQALHIDRVVIIQPSYYGTDNGCQLDGVKQLGVSRARAIVAIDLAKTTNAALDEMDRAGVRGIRYTLGTTVPEAQSRLKDAIERLKGRKWNINTNFPLAQLEGLRAQMLASPVPIVFDHFCGAQAALGPSQPGFSVLLDLLRAGKAYVKISRIHNVSTQAPDYADVAPIAKALIAANPERILWATDWPHAGAVPPRPVTEVTPMFPLDDGRVFNQFAVWAPDAAQRRTILVDNPVRLYGF